MESIDLMQLETLEISAELLPPMCFMTKTKNVKIRNFGVNDNLSSCQVKGYSKFLKLFLGKFQSQTITVYYIDYTSMNISTGRENCVGFFSIRLQNTL